MLTLAQTVQKQWWENILMLQHESQGNGTELA
jgi:hypothetical protein